MTDSKYTQEDLEIAEEFKRRHSRWICSVEDIAMLLATYQNGGTVMMDDSTIQLIRQDRPDHFADVSDEQLQQQLTTNINRALAAILEGYPVMTGPVTAASEVRYERDGSYAITFKEDGTKIGEIRIPEGCGAFCGNSGATLVCIKRKVSSRAAESL